MNRRILVAGVGNVFFGDDGFGVEVVGRMGRERWPATADVRDFGIRGLHLAYELLEPLQLVIIVDALAHGEPPGTVTLLEPELDPEVLATADAHGMNLPVVFATVRSLGGELPRVLLVGCEPANTREGMGLSEPVAAAVPEAIAMIRELLAGKVRSISRPAMGAQETKP